MSLLFLKFHNTIPCSGYIFTHCAGHLVSLFHLETHALQFWSLHMKIVSLLIFSVIFFLFMFYLFTPLKPLLFRCWIYWSVSLLFFFPSFFIFCLLYIF